MAEQTDCQTPGAIFSTAIHSDEVKISVRLPFVFDLSDEEAAILEANMHNAMELVLARYFQAGYTALRLQGELM